MGAVLATTYGIRQEVKLRAGIVTGCSLQGGRSVLENLAVKKAWAFNRYRRFLKPTAAPFLWNIIPQVDDDAKRAFASGLAVPLPEYKH